MSIIVSKTTPSVNVDPGSPIFFTYTINVDSPTGFPTMTAFDDPLPILNSRSQYSIISQNPPGFFDIVSRNPPRLAPVAELPIRLAPEIYTVTVRANTTIADAGLNLTNITETTIVVNGAPLFFRRIATASVAVCLHSSSKIKMADGSEKSIMDIKNNDRVQSTNGEATVVELVECGIKFLGKYSRCIVFEPDSLGPGIPSDRTAIDIGHPIAIPSDYQSVPTLHKASEYLKYNKDNSIYETTWDRVEDLLPGPNRRFDLVLEKTDEHYIANNLIVHARKNRLEPGYTYL